VGLSRTVSGIDGDFSRKSQNFPTLLYFAPPFKGFPLELGTGAGGKKNQNDGATGLIKKFDDIFSRVDKMPEHDGRSDRQTDTGPQQRPRLRIASHGKNYRPALQLTILAAPSHLPSAISRSLTAAVCMVLHLANTHARRSTSMLSNIKS